MTYDEMLAAAAEKIGHCRVVGGLVDDDVARQVLEAIGIVREEPDVSVVEEPNPDPEAHAE